MLAANQLINKILQTKDYEVIKTNGLEESYFGDYSKEFNFIVDHYKKYGNIPDANTFLSKFPDFEYQEVNETNDYILDQLYEEYGYRKFAKYWPELQSYIQQDSRVAFNYLNSILPDLKPHAVCKGIDIISQGMERYELFKNRSVDPDKMTIKTGLQELDEIFGGWEYGDELVTIVARTNQGKCLKKGTKVLMADGSLKTIEDIKIGDEVQSYNCVNKVIGLHNGVSKGYKVIPEDNGKSFIVTDKHILTISYQDKLVDIVIEDFLNKSKDFQENSYLIRCFKDKEILSRFRIERMNEEFEYYGFECNGDHRFLLEDHTLTHNSWILMKFLAEAWKQGKRVGLYSGEMNHIKLGYRFDALFQHFSNRALVQGGQTEGYKEYMENLSAIKNPFIVITQKEFGGKPTVQKIRNFIEENNIEIMGIDQFSLMEDGRASFRDPTRMRLSHIAEDLFLLSSEYKIPILGLAQANREGAKKEGETDAPGLENIKESDDIAHNSSKCIGMRQSSFGLVLDIIKNREGRVGDKLLYSWDIDTGHWSYIPSADDAARPETRQQFTHSDRQAFAPSTANPF